MIARSKKNVTSKTFARVKGEDNAPIKVKEFIDFQCPACAHGAKYLKETMIKYPGAIRLELGHYPLKSHQFGLLGSRYAECALQQGKFWPFHDLLLARQGNWNRLADAQPAFKRIAQEVDLNTKKLETCLQSDEADKAIEKNRDEGKKLGVRSTPTYFVNGKMIVGRKSLELEINRLLEKNGY